MPSAVEALSPNIYQKPELVIGKTLPGNLQQLQPHDSDQLQLSPEADIITAKSVWAEIDNPRHDNSFYTPITEADTELNDLVIGIMTYNANGELGMLNLEIDNPMPTRVGGMRFVPFKPIEDIQEAMVKASQNPVTLEEAFREYMKRPAKAMFSKWALLHRMIANAYNSQVDNLKQTYPDIPLEEAFSKLPPAEQEELTQLLYDAQASRLGGTKTGVLFAKGVKWDTLNESQKTALTAKIAGHVNAMNEGTPQAFIAPDMATNTQIMARVNDAGDNGCPYVICLPIEAPYYGVGDPSPSTAHGVAIATQEIITEDERFQDTDSKIILAVQGLGAVGSAYVREMADYTQETGRKITMYITDKEQPRIEAMVNQFGAYENLIIKTISPEDIMSITEEGLKIFVPNAGPGELTENNINVLHEHNFLYVSGAANNQFVDDEHGRPRQDLIDLAHELGLVVLTPEVVNWGGILATLPEIRRKLGMPESPEGRTWALHEYLKPMVRHLVDLSMDKSNGPILNITNDIIAETYVGTHQGFDRNWNEERTA